MPAPDPQRRRAHLISLLAKGPQDGAALCAALDVTRRTLHNDLKALTATYPGQVEELPRQQRRIRYAWRGLPPVAGIDRLALVALVAGRGLLRQPSCADGGLFGRAFDQILERLGLTQAAAEMDPAAIQAQHFAGQAVDDAVLHNVIEALLSGRCLRGQYRSLRAGGAASAVLLHPLRLLLLDGEPLLLAHDGHPRVRIKRYRLARLSAVELSDEPLPGAQLHFSQQEVDEHCAEAYRATHRAETRCRLILAVSPQAHPHLTGRHWGARQRWDEAPPDLPPGWSRLSFTTTGLDEARHWVLSLGHTVIAEAPPKLREWLGEQAQQLAGLYAAAPIEAAAGVSEGGEHGT